MTFRRLSKEKYFLAGLIAALIFILGLILGLVFEERRYQWIETETKEQENNFLSLQLQYLYLSSLDDFSDNCLVLQATLKNALEELSDSLSEVLEYEKDSQLNQRDFDLVGRRYLLDNLRYWFFAQEAKKKCHLKILPILYFYSENCPDCPLQGSLLTYYRELLDKKLLVFPLNSYFQNQEPMLDLLMSRYNITWFPSLIIDNQKYEGLVSQEQLKTIICRSLEDEKIC